MYLDVPCASFNGGLSPEQRRSEYGRFLSGEVRVLSCTDLASRGLDTWTAKHVINYDLSLIHI